MGCGSSTVGRLAEGAGGDRSLRLSGTAWSDQVLSVFGYFGVSDKSTAAHTGRSRVTAVGRAKAPEDCLILPKTAGRIGQPTDEGNKAGVLTGLP